MEMRTNRSIGIVSVIVGVICFFMVFVPPTRTVMIGSALGDYVAVGFTITGIMLAVVSLVKEPGKKWIPVIGLLLSLSYLAYWAILLVMLMMGLIPFAP
ncbi:MAG: hypothetical protein ACI4TD_11810 [Phocaeicola sp.]